MSDYRYKNVTQLYEKNEMDFDKLCMQYHLPVAVMLAILAVETNDDDGFIDGKLIIRFEAHKFIKYVAEDRKIEANNMFRYDKNRPWRGQQMLQTHTDLFVSYHGNQANEYSAFKQAKLIDAAAAYMSISMGLPQIMGFNHNDCGFISAKDMFNEFSDSTMLQITGMFEFLNNTMKESIRSLELTNFARLYNGNGKAEEYGTKIATAYIYFHAYLTE